MILLTPSQRARLLANGELKAGATFVVAGASKAAVEAVEKAGGKVDILPAKPKAERWYKPKAER